MTVRYSLRPDPGEHLGEFTLEIEADPAPHLELTLPSWVPGSYHLLPYPRAVRGVRASEGSGGPELRVERVAKGTWRIHRRVPGTPVQVQYSVYGYGIADEGFDITGEHLFLNAALCLPYVEGRKEEAAELTLHVPADWGIYTELEELGRHPAVYRARGYDELVDSPIDAGHPVVLTIRPGGIPHRIVICGTGGEYEAHRLEEEIGRIVQSTIDLVGESPLRHYTFFFHLTGKGDGGLEHSASTSIVLPRGNFGPGEPYRRFLSVTAHEYFHTYNVKRIRPKALGPFDYTRENYTRDLWWMEGVTSYFSSLVLRRAGLLTPAQYLEELAKVAGRFLSGSGRRHQSLEDSSIAAWVDLYHPYEETPNQSVNYYGKGELVGFCLDLEIRHRTEGRASLETVLRGLWKEYGKIDRGLEEGELLVAIGRFSGLELGEFFDAYVKGTAEIDFNAFARYAGLSFAPAPKPADEDGEAGYLGVRTESSEGRLTFKTVLAETPARRAGLSAGDELLAINGEKVGAERFDKTMRRFPPGTSIELAVFRRGLLTRATLTTGKAPPEKYAFRPVDVPTDLEKRVYEGWIGSPWEPAPPEVATAKLPAGDSRAGPRSS